MSGHEDGGGPPPELRAELDRLARSLGAQARAAFQAGELGEAHRLQLERLGLNQRLDSSDGIATTLYEMGCIELRMGRLTDAANHLGESVQRFLESGRADGIAVSARELGVVLRELRRPSEALPAFVEARDAYAWLGQEERVREMEEAIAGLGIGEA